MKILFQSRQTQPRQREPTQAKILETAELWAHNCVRSEAQDRNQPGFCLTLSHTHTLSLPNTPTLPLTACPEVAIIRTPFKCCTLQMLLVCRLLQRSKENKKSEMCPQFQANKGLEAALLSHLWTPCGDGHTHADGVRLTL